MLFLLPVIFISCFFNSIQTQLTIPIIKRHSNKNNIQAQSYSQITNNLRPTVSNLLQTTSSFNFPLSNYRNVQYYGELAIGSEGTTYTVIFDTGSDIFWLPSNNCEKCHKSKKFDCGLSKTCKITTEKDQRHYGSGGVSGKYVTDYVTLSDNLRLEYRFLLVDKDSTPSGFQADGVLGLNNENTHKNFIDIAYEAGYIKDKVFYFHLDFNPNRDVITKNSFLNVGSIPSEHVNDLIWLPVSSPSHWVTEVIGMAVNNNREEDMDYNDEISLLFDSGTSLVFVAHTIYEIVSKDLVKNGCTTFTNQKSQETKILCPCEEDKFYKYPNITFYTRGVAFNLTANEYLYNKKKDDAGKPFCLVGLESTKSKGASASKLQIVGDIFLKNSLVVFSKGNQTIGLKSNKMKALITIEDNFNYWSHIACILVGLASMLFARIRNERFKVELEKENETDYKEGYQRL